MRSKQLKGIVAVVLALACMLPMPLGSQAAATALQQEENTRTGKIPYYLYGAIPMREFATGGQEYFEEYAGEFLNGIGLDQSDLCLAFIYTYCMTDRLISSDPPDEERVAPLAAVWLTDEEAVQIVEHPSVLGCLKMSESGEYRPYDGFAPTNSFFALLILQSSVGLRPPLSLTRRENNVNMDDKVNAEDALLVLQASVGLIAIAHTSYLRAWLETGEPDNGGVKYDWEYERMPTRRCLIANVDENGDGVLDAVDAFLKYNYLWL